METALVSSGGVRLTTVEVPYCVRFESEPIVDAEDVAVAFDACNSGCYDYRVLYCALKDISGFQQFLRDEAGQPDALHSLFIERNDAGARDRECCVCGDTFSGREGAYYLKQNGEPLGGEREYRTAVFHQRCSRQLANALDEVWEHPAHALGTAL